MLDGRHDCSDGDSESLRSGMKVGAHFSHLEVLYRDHREIRSEEGTEAQGRVDSDGGGIEGTVI